MGQTLRTQESADRREAPRVPARRLALSYRCRGSMKRICVPAIDFNRYGMSMLTPAPLLQQEQLYLRLVHGGGVTASVVGVVHNCVRVAEGFRCGVRFRPGALPHEEPELAEFALAELESLLGDDSCSYAFEPPYEEG